MVRLQTEKQELEERVDKLEGFMLSPEFGKLSLTNRLLLETQFRTMGEYLTILYIRTDLIKAESFVASHRKASKPKIKRKK